MKTKECIHCKKNFEQKYTWMKYCSKTCRSRAGYRRFRNAEQKELIYPECGNTFYRREHYIKRVKICFCSDICGQKFYNVRHGDAKSNLHMRWQGIIQRCSKRGRYTKLGISVCEEWKNYLNFKSWAISSGFSSNLEIDRINPWGNYEPTNCRWITKLENANNRRDAKKITIYGETKTQSEWGRDPRLKVCFSTFRDRIKRGWPAELAISLPLQQGKKLKTTINNEVV